VKAADLTGVMCATVTPLADDGFTVDWHGVRSNARWLTDNAVRTLVVNGSIGEYPSLAETDRRRLVDETVAAVRGRARVVVGCSHNVARRAVELCRHAESAGADAVMLMAPSYFRHSDAAVVDFFRYVAERVRLPFLVYNNPAISGAEVPADALDAIAALPGYLGLKEATGNVTRYLDLALRFGDRFPIVAANESCLFHTLVAGSTGCMTASAAFAPGLLADLLSAVQGGELEQARRHWARLRAFRRLMQPDIDAGLPAYIPYTKAAMNCLGLRGGRPHFPMAPLGEAEVARLRDTLTHVMGLAAVERAGPAGER
jgi:4-hydroxy-tetrahydrodipicolinate synthase